MAIFRRGPDSAEAVYARMLDGEHLWLAVRGDGPLLLRRGGAADLELPTEPQTDAEARCSRPGSRSLRRSPTSMAPSSSCGCSPARGAAPPR